MLGRKCNFASGCVDGSISLWQIDPDFSPSEAATVSCVQKLTDGDSRRISELIFIYSDAQGNSAVSLFAAKNNMVIVWDAQSHFAQSFLLSPPTMAVSSVCVYRNSATVYTIDGGVFRFVKRSQWEFDDAETLSVAESLAKKHLSDDLVHPMTFLTTRKTYGVGLSPSGLFGAVLYRYYSFDYRLMTWRFLSLCRNTIDSDRFRKIGMSLLLDFYQFLDDDRVASNSLDLLLCRIPLMVRRALEGLYSEVCALLLF